MADSDGTCLTHQRPTPSLQVAHWFPGGVWDTKLMAASHPGGLFEDTTLGVLHNGLLGGELQDR